MDKTPLATTSGGPVALVIQTRIDDIGKAAYAAWQGRIGQQLASWPGFIGQEVRAPAPPVQTDWFVIQRFRSMDDARAWLASDELASALKEVDQYFVGDSDISVCHDAQLEDGAVSAAVTCLVAPEHEADFLAWERKMFLAEAKYPGFRGHRIERPIPGVMSRWSIVLTFASEAELSAWLNSAERAKLLDAGAEYQDDLRVHRTSYGFDFWFKSAEVKPTKLSILKGNLVVLLVLYPVVFLWGTFVGTPILTPAGVPFWAALFIGNLFSTQLLGWGVAPAAFKAFGWWLSPAVSRKDDAKGWAIFVALYVLSMAVFAWLLTLNIGK